MFDNIGYYGNEYTLYWHGVFSASIEFVCYLFGCGMVVNAVCGALFFAWSKRAARLAPP